MIELLVKLIATSFGPPGEAYGMVSISVSFVLGRPCTFRSQYDFFEVRRWTVRQLLPVERASCSQDARRDSNRNLSQEESALKNAPTVSRTQRISSGVTKRA